MTTETFLSAALELIVTSPTNPRKTFNEDKLNELARSIKASGVHQPILLRPLPGSRVPETGKKVQYEIVAGERRFRASKIAGLAQIPAMVRSLTDAQVLEIQLIENLQRDDLSELEEAEGYQTLHTTLGERKGLSADEIADRIGKSRRYVYNRLKLLDTAPEVQAALREGKIDASRALVIGTIRRMSDQVKALEMATQPHTNGQPRSVRGLSIAIRERFFLEIRDIPWNENDISLAGQGPCSTCTKRSDRETEKDLFDQGDGTALCLDADCHSAKEAAHTQQLVDHWATKGAIYKTNDQAVEEELLRWYNESDGHNAIRAGQVREDLPAPHTGKTIQQLLGKDAKGITTYAIESSKPGEPVAIYYDRAETKAALKAKGIDLDRKPSVHGNDDDGDEEPEDYTELNRQRAQERQTSLRIQTALLESLQSKNFMSSDVANRHVLQWIAKDVVDYGDANEIGEAFNIDPDEVDAQDALHREAEKSLEHCIKIIAAHLITQSMHDDTAKPAAAHLLSAVGISRSEIEAKVQADLDAERKAVLKALNTPSLDAPAAQPKGSGEGAQLAPKKSARAKKLSAEEAELGIAAAMQGLDDAAPASAVAPPASQEGGQIHPVADPSRRFWLDPNSKDFEPGVKVKITSDVDKLDMRQLKFAGKQGAIVVKSGDAEWDVSFKGRSGGLASFTRDQLELVPA
jgi:ParB/RepB/Spo0J family partition protein